MKILAIVNPQAAGGKTLRLLPKLQRWLSETSHQLTWSVTLSAEEMRGEILAALPKGMTAVLLIGGDGTIHEALPALREVNLPFGLIPCGRGNDFARNIGLSLDPRRNCLLGEGLHEFLIDLPMVNGQPFGSIACTGFDALVNRLARDKKGYLGGTPGYVICVLKALRAFQSFEIGIAIDDFFWQGKVMMVAVANGPFYGGGMKIAPHAKMDDGLFEVCVIKEISKRELIREFPKVFRGAHVSHPRCLIRCGKTVKISSPEEREVFADGEHVSNLPVLCSMGERKISVLLPERPASETKGG